MLGSFPCPPCSLTPLSYLPHSLSVLLPLCHINVYLTGWKTACLFPVISVRERKKTHRSLSLLFKATWRFLSSQSLLGIWGQREGESNRKMVGIERTDMRDVAGKWIKVCGWGNVVWANREIVPNLVTALNTWLPPRPQIPVKRTLFLPPLPSSAPKPQTPSYLSLFFSGLLHTGRKRSYLSPVSIWQPWVTRRRTA